MLETYIVVAVVVPRQVHSAVRAPADLLDQDILVHTVVSPPIHLVVGVLDAGIEGLLRPVSGHVRHTTQAAPHLDFAMLTRRSLVVPYGARKLPLHGPKRVSHDEPRTSARHLQRRRCRHRGAIDRGLRVGGGGVVVIVERQPRRDEPTQRRGHPGGGSLGLSRRSRSHESGCPRTQPLRSGSPVQLAWVIGRVRST